VGVPVVGEAGDLHGRFTRARNHQSYERMTGLETGGYVRVGFLVIDMLCNL
jgi:hypothetical protein